MEQIEDQAHTLFSSLVRASYSGKKISFEGQEYPTGIGPRFVNEKGNFAYDLTGKCGLLGFGHPLVIKSYIKSTLSGKMFASCKDVESFLLQFQQFAQRFGVNSNWSILQVDRLDSLNGRTSQFFNTLDDQSISNVFPFVLEPSDSMTYSHVPQHSITLAIDTLKFLRDGNFYGSDGLISLRQRELEEVFNQDWVENVNGLCVSLRDTHPLKDTNVLTLGNKLVFPLSFDDSQLNEILKEAKS